MNDPMEHATGLEKRELLAKAAGNDNPFDMKVFKRGAGTKENPNLIPSAFDARIVGCICKINENTPDIYTFFISISVSVPQAKKIKLMCSGCGCKRVHPNVANAVIGSNWLRKLLFKLNNTKYLQISFY